MSKEKTIEPELFEIVTEHNTYYIVAYDTAHAIMSLIEGWSSEKDIKSVKKLTDDWAAHLFVAKECLPQRLVNKIVYDNKSKT
jgi:hypothetical protein